MSLACSACEQDMRPSDSFPGREGVMVSANVLALIWADDESVAEQWPLSYVEAPARISLCFRCVAGTLSQERQSVLAKVYEAYEAEIIYRRAKVSEEGKWFSSGEMSTSFNLFEIWEERCKAIPGNQCIFCAKEILDNQNPYFTARVIDKVYSEQHTTQWITGQNYSWSNMKTGMTSFKICFICLRKHFVSTCKVLGYGLGVTRNPDQEKGRKCELYMTSQFIDALRRSAGEEKAQKLLREASEDLELRLAVDPKSIPEN